MELPFVFDTTKSSSNRAKHGIDFVEAQALWRDSSTWSSLPGRERRSDSS